MRYLSGFDMNEAQKNELLQTLWNIVGTMVNIGFGLDSVQMFLSTVAEKTGQDSEKLVEIKHTEYFNSAAQKLKG